MGKLEPEGLRRLLWWAFVAAVLVTAWVADDAYISFRTVERVVAGEGFTWNEGERVQAFTHPLWFFLHVAARWVTGEIYLTTLALCLFCSLTAARFLAFRLAGSAKAGAAILVVLIGSRAWMDYTTSGLENPLSNLLVVCFVGWGWRARSLERMSAAAALLGLNRLDLLGLVLPALVYEWWHAERPARWRAALLVLVALATWEVISLVQFGTLVPNTAFAKLGTGIGLGPRILQGVYFLVGACVHDGLTMGILAGLLWAGVRRPDGRTRALAAGVVIYLAYLITIGGDSMMGRFFTPPLALLLAWRSSGPLPSFRLGKAVGAGLMLLGVRLISSFTLPAVDPVGVGDERRVWSPHTGLVGWLYQDPWPESRWRTQVGVDCEVGNCVQIQNMVGLHGYYADAGVFVVDEMALADPFRSRLPGIIADAWNRPGRLGWRPAHVPRPIPAGYLETVRTGVNHIEDPDLARVWDAVALVTRGPLWSKARWRAIWQLNTGDYDDEIERWVARNPQLYQTPVYNGGLTAP